MSTESSVATAAKSNTPLLRPRQGSDESLELTSSTLPAMLAMLLGRATGQRGAFILVRETAPNTPIRLWICGYAFQCLVHVVLVGLEYRRRNTMRRRSQESPEVANDTDEDDFGEESSGTSTHSMLNTMASFLWWIVGFYWVFSGGYALLLNAPRLYWEYPILVIQIGWGQNVIRFHLWVLLIVVMICLHSGFLILCQILDICCLLALGTCTWQISLTQFISSSHEGSIIGVKISSQSYVIKEVQRNLLIPVSNYEYHSR
ncbi:hypothetical protein UlMin_038669 [Ulmus minor]